VRYYRSGSKRSTIVGRDLDLTYDALEVPAEPGADLVGYTAAPDAGSRRCLWRALDAAAVADLHLG